MQGGRFAVIVTPSDVEFGATGSDDVDSW